ncbi:MAG: hypothetical protein QXS48_00265 [Candidatus Aenigmatarchaeota archaeon]
MKKAQTYILQFVIFFVVGFIVFLGIGSLFRAQSDYFTSELAYRNAKLTSDYISSVAITLKNSCKECDYSRIVTSSKTSYEFIIKAGRVWEIILVDGRRYLFSLHNLNSSIDSEGSAISTKPLTLTFSKIENKLMVE